MLVAAFLLVTGCQGDKGSAGEGAAEKGICYTALGKDVESAVRRVAGIPDSVKITRYGNPEDSVDKLITMVAMGTPEKATRLEFCRFYRETVVSSPPVEVTFWGVREVPKRGADALGKSYRMAKGAAATSKLGVLYFECSSEEFSLGLGGATKVLIRGESRTNDEVAESDAAAYEDNLRIIHASSRVYAELLGCEANAGIPATFSMPPEV
ncbi:hypothetical protein [Streptomyces sp. CAI-85]|uniref:hypothetical protein n=1 Tax=Streptomyces sp. CAI-85 TaxID=1472662 RepID=UPI0015876A88|nr:hypothetical protein [Streptomyces sp. CAI-85]NUV65040.1 hypothetical protein [Streptomyces sp. CAI-85]